VKGPTLNTKSNHARDEKNVRRAVPHTDIMEGGTLLFRYTDSFNEDALVDRINNLKADHLSYEFSEAALFDLRARKIKEGRK
jgi:hypothetical protein